VVLSPGMALLHINPSSQSTPVGYSHVVVASGRRTVFVAGQVAFDRDGNIVGKGDLRVQAVRAYTNLEAVLESAGASLADVVKLTTYVVGYRIEYRQIIREVRDEFLKGNEPPAAVLVGVESLALPELLIEIDAIAVVE
jgi:enamine deaminase RidA (YjgF/YER057c/UK114 family)